MENMPFDMEDVKKFAEKALGKMKKEKGDKTAKFEELWLELSSLPQEVAAEGCQWLADNSKVTCDSDKEELMAWVQENQKEVEKWLKGLKQETAPTTGEVAV